MATASTPVLYVGGGLRTGSTIVDRFLGTRPGVLSLGEVGQTWHLGVLENRRCTCGAVFGDCPFWSALATRLPEALGEPVARSIDAYNLEIFPTRRLLRVMTRSGVRRTVDGAPAAYHTALSRLYEGFREQTGANLLVDSSKHPVYLAMLATVPTVDLRMIHLVRDSRAVAYSWRRKVIEPGASVELHMQRLSPARSALYWSLWNIATERVSRALDIPTVRIRYEDFADAPEATLERAVGRLYPEGISREAPTSPRPHLLSGNPSRFDEGPVTVRADTEWQAKMSRLVTSEVTALTLPLLRRYGYPVRPSGVPSR